MRRCLMCSDPKKKEHQVIHKKNKEALRFQLNQELMS